VKAAYTKCVRAVWAADGGQRASAPPPTREWRDRDGWRASIEFPIPPAAFERQGWELLWSELFSAPAYNFSREDRTIQPQRDFVRVKVRPLARLGSGETAHDFALWIDL
jgi:predicted deacetylase